MGFKAYNRSNRDVSDLEQMMKSFMPFAQKRIGFNRPPTINFESDDVNAKNALGKTGFYDPTEMSITVFVDGRHPKDVLRSLSHELVHHGQNCRGDLSSSSTAGEQGYAQKDPHLREMEREAYEVGNLCFRDWEDNYKQQTNYVEVSVSLSENKQLRSKTMGINDKLNNALNKSLMERWGYKITEEEEEESLNEFGAASSREEPGSGERRKKERGDRYQAHEEVEHEEDVVEEGEEEEELEESTIGSYSSGEKDRRPARPMGSAPAPGSDCNPEEDVTCPPEVGEKAVASLARKRYGGTSEAMIRKIVRETIRRKLKKNG